MYIYVGAPLITNSLNFDNKWAGWYLDIPISSSYNPIIIFFPLPNLFVFFHITINVCERLTLESACWAQNNSYGKYIFVLILTFVCFVWISNTRLSPKKMQRECILLSLSCTIYIIRYTTSIRFIICLHV